MESFSKFHVKRLEVGLERLVEIFATATPDDPETMERREENKIRLEELKAAAGGETRICLMCMTPRSGSTFFSEALTKTGLLGSSGEWFNANPGSNIEKMVKLYGCQTREELLDAIYIHSATDNGVAIIKGDFHQCLPFIFDDLFERHFGHVKWVQLTREDLLAQAISRYIGTVTQSWSSIQEVKNDDVPYDREEIGKQLEFLIEMEGGWKRFFNSRHISAVTMSYEQLNRNLSARVEQVGKMMKVKVKTEVTSDDLRLKKQATDRNQKWARRYAKETRKLIQKAARTAQKRPQVSVEETG